MSSLLKHLNFVTSTFPGQSFEELVLKQGHQPSQIHGASARREDLSFVPKKFRVPKHCFQNAASLVRKDPFRYTYVEGFFMSFIPIHHAWVFDDKLQSDIEITLREDFKTRELRPERYRGIQLEIHLVTEIIHSAGHYGVAYSRIFREFCAREYGAPKLSSPALFTKEYRQ